MRLLVILALLLMTGCAQQTSKWTPVVTTNDSPDVIRQKFYTARYQCDEYSGIVYEHCMNSKGWELK